MKALTNTDILIAADSKNESRRKAIKHLALVSLYDAIAIDCIAKLGVCTYLHYCNIPKMNLQRARRLTSKGFIKIQSKNKATNNNKSINHYVLTNVGLSKSKDINAFCDRIRAIFSESTQNK